MASFLLINDRNLNYAAKRMFSSLSESGFIPTMYIRNVLEVALQEFSSLSESGFIPTIPRNHECSTYYQREFSSLSESGFIPTSSLIFRITKITDEFSSLSESGFIPTISVQW